MHEQVIVDLAAKTVTVPHLGMTLRSILGGASTEAWNFINSMPEEYQRTHANWRPKFRIVYKGVVIGEIRLKALQQFKLGKTLTDEQLSVAIWG